jgi:DNA mismatch repair protein MutS
VLYSAGVTERFEKNLYALRQPAPSPPADPRPDWQFDSGLGERKLLEQLGAPA